jgi:glutamate synthase domain-containing protein 1
MKKIKKFTIFQKFQKFHTNKSKRCGILSLIQQNQKKFTDLDLFKRSLHALEHRGPENEGIFKKL